MCFPEVPNSKNVLRSFYLILMFGLLSNISSAAKSIVSLGGMLVNKLYMSKKLLVELTFFISLQNEKESLMQ